MEVPASFRALSIPFHERYSLHTEYSYGYQKKKLDNPNLAQYKTLSTSFEHEVPLLWRSKEWALEFADYLVALVGNNPSPEIIEIHPPFASYSDTDSFIDVYSVFEKGIRSVYPNVVILIENRSGTEKKRDPFIISSVKQIIEFCEKITDSDLVLRLTLDIPQLLTTHRTKVKNKIEQVDVLLEIVQVRDQIHGIHLWGKSPMAHMGDLDTTFKNDADTKQRFLGNMASVFDDNLKRYFVPEVNSSPTHLHSIVSDVQEAGFIFV